MHCPDSNISLIQTNTIDVRLKNLTGQPSASQNLSCWPETDTLQNQSDQNIWTLEAILCNPPNAKDFLPPKPVLPRRLRERDHRAKLVERQQLLGTSDGSFPRNATSHGSHGMCTCFTKLQDAKCQSLCLTHLNSSCFSVLIRQCV